MGMSLFSTSLKAAELIGLELSTEPDAVGGSVRCTAASFESLVQQNQLQLEVVRQQVFVAFRRHSKSVFLQLIIPIICSLSLIVFPTHESFERIVD